MTVDASAEDWADRGLRVDLLADVEGNFREPEDFDPKLRLGWSEKGLWVLAEVRDDDAVESDIDRRLFTADSLEFFVGTSRQEHDYFMFLVAPGIDPDHPEPRHIFFDERDGGPVVAASLPPLHAEWRAAANRDGHIVEALIPWDNLDLIPQPGLTLAFQVYAMDRDPGESTFRVAWYPAFDTHQNQTRSMVTLRLEDAGADPPPMDSLVRGRYRDVVVVASADQAGTPVRVERRGEPLAEALLTSTEGRASATMRLPQPPRGEALGALDVYLGDTLLETVLRGSAAAMLGTAVEEGGLSLYQHVFSGPTFPKVEFQNPRLVEDLIGPYRLVTRYFGPDATETTRADAPGRYGVVVTVLPEHGRGSSRFFTLFRTPDDRPVLNRQLPPWLIPDLDAVLLPNGLTLEPDTTREPDRLDQADAIRRAADWERASPPESSPSATSSPVTFAPEAGSYVSTDGSAVDPDVADQAYWVRCKRRFYGLADAPVRLPTPLPEAGVSDATRLREGIPEEAGLDPGVITELEAICDRWAASNKGQGFTVCAARRGVAFFHRAYGQLDGQPVTTHTPAQVYSTSKAITGAVVMLYMDRGLVDVDAPIGRYLPALADIDVPTPFTIRQLMTHTSGLTGHYGDEFRDFEERVADEYPYLTIPVQHIYNSKGFALTAKAMELMSDKPFPTLYHEVLFGPLGMADTSLTDSYSAIYTTAWDLALLGQLMLNGGVYDGHRYFRPETLEQAKPQPLVTILGPQTQHAWGIGFWGSREAERRSLGGTAFGHNSRNSSLFRVDPATDLVVTVASLEEKRYLSETMRREFIEAIESAIRDAP